MIVCKKIFEIRELVDEAKKKGKTVGFVPTMGALHRGHLELVTLAKERSDVVVMSIFVNPTQFNSLSDFELYPRTEERDIALAEEAGVDIVFIPDANEMYPAGIGAKDTVHMVAGKMSKGFEGACRPGHFDGVVTVVNMLFNIVQPDIAIFGEKDFQQVKVVEEMVSETHQQVKIITGATVREESGLAMSSRNQRLSAEEKEQAVLISKSLFEAKKIVERGGTGAERIKEEVFTILNTSPKIKIEYIEVVSSETLEPIPFVVKHTQLLIAAYIGEVRLIDNICVTN